MTGDDRVVTVRPAGADDLPKLIAAHGQPQYFARRLRRQPQLGIVLIAERDDGKVVGSAFLRLAAAEEWELRERLPKSPVLTHVAVVEDQQGNGVGPKLVQSAEELARARGRRSIALGVKDENERARRMYLRLGYRDWGCGPINAIVETFKDDDDDRAEVSTESCQILVKALRGEVVIRRSAGGGPPGPAGRRGRRRGRPRRRR